jgi:hypothetical protein
VLGKARAHEWPAIAEVLEESGLPPINPVFGMRYRPAVMRWFDVYENVVRQGPPPEEKTEYLQAGVVCAYRSDGSAAGCRGSSRFH